MVGRQLACERVRADHREGGAENDRRSRSAEEDIAREEHERPAQGVLREEHAVADATEPWLEEEGKAAAAREDLSFPECVDLPQVDRLVAIPGVGRKDQYVHHDRDRYRPEDNRCERPELTKMRARCACSFGDHVSHGWNLQSERRLTNAGYGPCGSSWRTSRRRRRGGERSVRAVTRPTRSRR